MAIFLSVSTITCNICVLVGNHKTATALVEMGRSTRGWSGVGRELSQALQWDLDDRMVQVSTHLLQSLDNVTVIQKSLNFLLAMVGKEFDKAVDASPTLSMMQTHGPGALSLLQQKHGSSNPDISKIRTVINPVITKAVHKVVTAVMDQASVLVHKLVEALKPALLQVGKWITTFGEKIQAGLEAFTVALDLVQKIFDMVMREIHEGNGDYRSNEEAMLSHTFNLFDASNTGFVSVQDLRDAAKLYSITALQGDLASKLATKYDSNGDGVLDRPEMKLLVNDEAVPGSMGTVLRDYSKRLAEVGGSVAAARHRDEVALAVVEYFGVVTSKNMTKVEWIADRLANSSLPLEFTVDIMAELCQHEVDPRKLTTSSIGNTVVSKMYDLHPKRTSDAVLMLSNTTFWALEGFRVQEQAPCLKMVMTWITGAASLNATMSTSAPQKTWSDMESLVSVLDSDTPAPDPETLQALPDEAFRLTQEGVSLYLLEQHMDNMGTANDLLASGTSRHLQVELLDGLWTTNQEVHTPTVAEQAVRSGTAAAPETLEFARWLANNATRNAKMYADMCFQYSGESSNALDKWATDIQGMVTLTQGFLDEMMKYSTPSGIERLVEITENFQKNALQDVATLVENKIMGLINRSFPLMERIFLQEVHDAGEQFGDQLEDLIEPHLAKGLNLAMAKLLMEDFSERQLEVEPGSALQRTLTTSLGDSITNLTLGRLDLGQRFGDVLERCMEILLSEMAKKGADKLDSVMNFADSDRASSLSEVEADESRVDLSGVWFELTDMLRDLSKLLPTSVVNLKFARKKISGLVSHMDIGFDVLENRAAPVFDGWSDFWRTAWTTYFVVLVILNLLTLFYAFWSSGFFGGPSPLRGYEGEDDDFENKPFWQKVRLGFGACGQFMAYTHDTQLCMWSGILFAQVIFLATFVFSIIFCILGAAKTFLVLGCKKVWILGDEEVCTSALLNLRSFLSTFLVGKDSLSPIRTTCIDDRLTTCSLIQRKMLTSTILTVAFSIITCLVTLNLIIDAGIRHERARYRRIFVALHEEKEENAKSIT